VNDAIGLGAASNVLVRDVAAALSAQVVGDGSLNIERVVHPSAAERSSDLAVAITADALTALATSKAQAAVVADKSAATRGGLKAAIVTTADRSALAKLTALFDGGPVHGAGVHSTAIVAPDAAIGDGVSIGAYVTVGARSRIGARTVILPNVSIGADVSIGANGLIYSGVRIGDRVSIGERVIIHFNAAIGNDGFSFLPATGRGTGAKPTRVHSLGDVAIGNDVEIGANTTIDRATLETTRIGDGTKIDNLVQIAHNAQIGQSCLICGMVGVSGSVEIGDRVLLGGGVGIADHIKIGSDAMVAAGSGVGTNVAAGSKVSGYPAMPHERAVDIIAFLSRHKRLLRDLDDVKARVAALGAPAELKK
jgi:UDP-3-O-[3-hydroxymyristoyl] glucosamine N-acyltransferase